MGAMPTTGSLCRAKRDQSGTGQLEDQINDTTDRTDSREVSTRARETSGEKGDLSTSEASVPAVHLSVSIPLSVSLRLSHKS